MNDTNNELQKKFRETIVPCCSELDKKCDFPKLIEWYATYKCNRNCVYCYNDYERNGISDQEIETQQLINVFKSARENGCKYIRITGGEPFLRKDFLVIIRSLKEINYKVSVTTKFHITKDLAKELAQIGVDEITVSLDTYEQDIAKILYGTSSVLEEITDSIQNLVKFNINSPVSCIINKLNLPNLENMIKFIEELGGERISFALLTNINQKKMRSLFISENELNQLISTIIELKEKYKNRIQVGGLSFSPIKLGEFCNNGVHCKIGISSVLILPDGKLGRCDKLIGYEQNIIGDLNANSIEHYWNSDVFKNKIILKKTDFKDSICTSCTYLENCISTGRCLYNSLILNGNVFGPDRLCPYNKDFKSIFGII